VAGEYLRATSLINSLILPALAAIAVLAHDIVSLLYGSTWLQAAPAIPWLCLAYAVSSLFTLSTPALTGVGKPYASIGPTAFLVFVKIAFAWWLMDGTLRTFAVAIALGQLLSAPAMVLMLYRHLGLPVLAWLKNTLSVFALAASIGTLCWIIRILLPDGWPSILTIAVTGSAAVIAFVFVSRALSLPISHELQRLFKQLHKKPSPPM
nr:polysaccharide biosynthesis C-terminal domain-containing protein [Acidovorax sp.]